MTTTGPSHHTLDDLDRKIVAALQIDGRASWSTIAELCGTTGPTVARRVQQLVNDGVVKVAVMRGAEASDSHEFYFLRLRCGPVMALTVARRIAERPDIRFVTLLTGQYDIIAEAMVPRRPGSYHALVQEIQAIPGVEGVSGELILHVYKVSHDWARELLGLEPAEPAATTKEYAEVRLEEADAAILDSLQVDARASFSDVAKKVGMNESTVRRRFERLLSRQWAHVVTLVQATALGFEAEVQLRVDVEPAQLTEVAGELARRPEVRYLALTLGTNGLVAEVITRHAEQLYTFITDVLAGLPGVTGWTASLELLTVKRGFVETPWWQMEVARIGSSANEPPDACDSSAPRLGQDREPSGADVVS